MKVTITLDFPDKRRAIIARWIAWISGKPQPELATNAMLRRHIRDAVRDRDECADYWDRGQEEPDFIGFRTGLNIRRGVVHTYTLDDGATIIMCTEHRNLIRDRVVADDGHEPGGKWRCAVCTIHRRLTGGLAEPKSVVFGNYVVTRYPTGVIYCTCPRWRFMRVPPADRECKHIDAVRMNLVEKTLPAWMTRKQTVGEAALMAGTYRWGRCPDCGLDPMRTTGLSCSYCHAPQTPRAFQSSEFTRHNDSLVADASTLRVAPGQVPHYAVGANAAVRGVVVVFPDGTSVQFVYTGVHRNADGDVVYWEYHRGATFDGVRNVTVFND